MVIFFLFQGWLGLVTLIYVTTFGFALSGVTPPNVTFYYHDQIQLATETHVVIMPIDGFNDLADKLHRSRGLYDTMKVTLQNGFNDLRKANTSASSVLFEDVATAGLEKFSGRLGDLETTGAMLTQYFQGRLLYNKESSSSSISLQLENFQTVNMSTIHLSQVSELAADIWSTVSNAVSSYYNYMTPLFKLLGNGDTREIRLRLELLINIAADDLKAYNDRLLVIYNGLIRTSHGNLDPAIVAPADLSKVLHKARVQSSSLGLFLPTPIEDLDTYYRNVYVAISTDRTSSLCLVMAVPLIDRRPYYSVYEAVQVPHVSERQKLSFELESELIAVSEDNYYYVTLSNYEYRNCKEFPCVLNRARYSLIHGQNCISSLFRKNHHGVMYHCVLVSKPLSPYPLIHRLYANHHLVESAQGMGVESICSNYTRRQIVTSDLYVISVDVGCRLRSDVFDGPAFTPGLTSHPTGYPVDLGGLRLFSKPVGLSHNVSFTFSDVDDVNFVTFTSFYVLEFVMCLGFIIVGCGLGLILYKVYHMPVYHDDVPVDDGDVISNVSDNVSSVIRFDAGEALARSSHWDLTESAPAILETEV